MSKKDDQDAQAKKLSQEQAQIAKLKDQNQEIDQKMKQIEERLKLAKQELDQRNRHYQTLSQYLDLELGDQKSGRKDVVQQKNKIIEKKAHEKLNFHLDKYFNYIKDSLEDKLVEDLQGDQETSYAAHSTTAVLVKFSKSLFDEKVETQIAGDDEDYVVNTFRIAKSHQIYDVKLAALRYWQYMHDHQYDDKEQDQKEYDKEAQFEETRFKQVELVSEELKVCKQNKPIDAYIQDETGSKNMFTIILRPTKSARRKVGQKQKKEDKSAVVSVSHAQSDPNKSQNNSNADKTGNNTATANQTTAAQTGGLSTHNAQKSVNHDGSKSVQSEQTINNIKVVNDDEERQDDKHEKQLAIPLYRHYFTFFERFKLIKKMFVIDEASVIKRGEDIQAKKVKPKKGITCDDNNVCVIFLLTMLLMLNAFQLSLLEDGAFMQSHITAISGYLNLGQPGVVRSFQGIATLTDIAMFYTNPLNFALQIADPNSTLRKDYQIIGAVRFRQQRTNYNTCQYPTRSDIVSSVKCTYNHPSSATSQTSPLSDDLTLWHIYHSSNELAISRSSKGKLNSYDSSGYIIDLNQTNLTIPAYQSLIKQQTFSIDSYLTQQTLAHIVTFTLRSLNDNAFFFIELIVELTSTTTYPNPPTITPFSPNIFGKGSSSPYSTKAQRDVNPPDHPDSYNAGIRLEVIIIFKIIVGILWISFVLLRIIDQFKSGNGLKYFISIQFILNLSIIYTNYQNVADAFSQANNNLDVLQLVKTQTYVDLGNAAQQYQTFLYSTGACLLVILVRIFFLLTFFRSFETIITSIEQQYLSLFASFLMLMFVLLGFAFVSISIWGQYTDNFSTFGRAILSLMLLVMGSFDKDSLWAQQPVLALIFGLCFFFFIISFMFNILAVIYIDSYRLLIVEQGEGGQEAWDSKDWFLWALSWVPEKFQKKCNKAMAEAAEATKNLAN